MTHSQVEPTGALIVVRHAIPFHPAIKEQWEGQIANLSERLEPYLPENREQAITLTSSSERALVVAQQLFDRLGVVPKRQPELKVGSIVPISAHQVLEVVVSELHRFQLVIAISHEPICEQLAVDAAQLLSGEEHIPKPDFSEYTTAVLIDPHHMPDGVWRWLYL